METVWKWVRMKINLLQLPASQKVSPLSLFPLRRCDALCSTNRRDTQEPSTWSSTFDLHTGLLVKIQNAPATAAEGFSFPWIPELVADSILNKLLHLRGNKSEVPSLLGKKTTPKKTPQLAVAKRRANNKTLVFMWLCGYHTLTPLQATNVALMLRKRSATSSPGSNIIDVGARRPSSQTEKKNQTDLWPSAEWSEVSPITECVICFKVALVSSERWSMNRCVN